MILFMLLASGFSAEAGCRFSLFTLHEESESSAEDEVIMETSATLHNMQESAFEESKDASITELSRRLQSLQLEEVAPHQDLKNSPLSRLRSEKPLIVSSVLCQFLTAHEAARLSITARNFYCHVINSILTKNPPSNRWTYVQRLDMSSKIGHQLDPLLIQEHLYFGAARLEFFNSITKALNTLQDQRNFAQNVCFSERSTLNGKPLTIEQMMGFRHHLSENIKLIFSMNDDQWNGFLDGGQAHFQLLSTTPDNFMIATSQVVFSSYMQNHFIEILRHLTGVSKFECFSDKVLTNEHFNVFLKNNTDTLREFCVKCYVLGKKGLAHVLETALCLPKLQVLDLRENNISDEQAKVISAAMRHLPSLKTLTLSLSDFITQNDPIFPVARIMDFCATLPQTVKLVVDMSDDQWDKLIQKPSILSLINEHAPNHFMIMKKGIAFIEVKEMHDTAMRLLSHITGVKSFDCSKKELLTSESYKTYFKTFLTNNAHTLTNLQLSHNNIDNSCPLIEVLPHLTSLEWLVLEKNNFGNEAGKRILSALTKSENLQRLILRNSDIDDTGAQTVITFSKYAPKLEVLDLRGNKLGNEIKNKIWNAYDHRFLRLEL